MWQGLLAVTIAVVFCTVASLLLRAALAAGLPAANLVLVTASATLLLSATAVFFAWRAFRRANAAADEMRQMTLSMDSAMRDFSLRSDRDRAMVGDLNAQVAREIDALAARMPRPGDSPPAQAPQVLAAVQPTTVRRGVRKIAANASAKPEQPRTDESAVTAALRQALAAGRCEVSLQPVISASRGAAAGFDVCLHIEAEGMQAVDLRRAMRPVPGIDPASLERLALLSAAAAAETQLADLGDGMPLQVAVGEALLGHPQELDAAMDLFRQDPALAHRIVVSIPAEVLESKRHDAAIDQLETAGIRLAVEGWAEPALLKRAGAAFVRLPAARLLDRVRMRGRAGSGAALVEAAAQAGIAIIATEVGSDEDAMGLVDLGVDLMSGERFSGPRRLKAAMPQRQMRGAEPGLVNGL